MLLKQRAELLLQLQQRAREQTHHWFQRKQDGLRAAMANLRLLGPEQVLARGYSITMDAQTGKVLRDAKALKPGQRLRSRLRSGEVTSIVQPGSLASSS